MKFEPVTAQEILASGSLGAIYGQGLIIHYGYRMFRRVKSARLRKKVIKSPGRYRKYVRSVYDSQEWARAIAASRAIRFCGGSFK